MATTTTSTLAQVCATLQASSQKDYRRPKQCCFSLDDIFAQAEKDIKASIAVNQSLRDEIDGLRGVIQTMTKTTKALEKELLREHKAKEIKTPTPAKPTVLFTMKVDPNVKMAQGNTLDKAAMWQKEPQK